MQEVVHGAVDRLEAIVERVELALGLGEAVHLAEPAAEAAQHRLVGQHGIGDQPGKADVVAADREQQQIDLARACSASHFLSTRPPFSSGILPFM